MRLIFCVVLYLVGNFIIIIPVTSEKRLIEGNVVQHVPNFAQVLAVNEETRIRNSGGGVFLTHQVILTQAAMVVGYNNWVIRYGLENVFDDVINAVSHPDFNPETFENDIALLLASQSTEITAPGQIYPSDLYTNLPIGTIYGHFPGRGYINTEPFVTDENLRSIYMSSISNDRCRLLLGIRSGILTQTHFCILDSISNASTICNGDLGGPFYQVVDEFRYIVGIGSIVTNMCNPKFPALMTAVPMFVDWIEMTMSEILD